ncbi:MAG: terpene cyclase/mutase family protein [Candidatus Methanoperedens sp.]|nr:terpene cyclase/mutase family protein [Candidatus Methanoperedens sp.]CAG1009824.1 hypothetical protein METP1_03780 [Methanosarcinales archaeon]
MTFLESRGIIKINGMWLLGVMAVFILVIVIAVPLAAATPDMGDCNEKHGRYEEVNRAIEKGIMFLESKQLQSGEFPVEFSFDPEMEYIVNDSIFNHTIFGSAFILHALSYVKPSSQVNNIRNRSISFLIDNMEPPGVWSYGGKYYYSPPDSDDTALTLSALEENGVRINDSSLRFMLNFRTDEGLFHTWMIEDRSNISDPHSNLYALDDVDASVNAYILYAYAFNDMQIKEVSRFLNNFTKNKLFINGTPYYPSQYAFIYRLTLAYAGGAKGLDSAIPTVREYLLDTQKTDGSWGNNVENGFAAVSLINIGYEDEALDKAINHILSTQKDEGSWPRAVFYVGWPSSYESHLGPVPYFGSEELATGISLEALGKYKNLKK